MSQLLPMAIFLPRIAVLAMFLALLATPVASTPVPKGATVMIDECTSPACPERNGPVINSDPSFDFEIRLSNGDVVATGVLQDRLAVSNRTGGLIFLPKIRFLELNPQLDRPFYNIEGYTIWGLGWGLTDVSVHTEAPSGTVLARAKTAKRGKNDSTVTILYDTGFASKARIPGVTLPPGVFALQVSTESAPHSILTDWRIHAPKGAIRIFGIAGDATRSEEFEVLIKGTSALNNPL